jgi:REP element-mobilizing transposase RayT
MSSSKHLTRLERVWIDDPVFFITTCTADRRAELANDRMHDICREVWTNATARYGWVVGRYVLMPDHAHFFCAPQQSQASLQLFVGKWKEWTAKYAHRRHGLAVPLWQPEFFDHVLRSVESYDQRWEYVLQNPMRARLVKDAAQWPWQGEIHELRM